MEAGRAEEEEPRRGGEPRGRESEVSPQSKNPLEQGGEPRFSVDPREPVWRSFVSHEILQNNLIPTELLSKSFKLTEA